MALGGSRPFEAAAFHARVSLTLNLPIGSAVNTDPLALALVLRRELFDKLVSRPSTGPLPARKLAARILERASREAVRRSYQGDRHPAELLISAAVRPTL